MSPTVRRLGFALGGATMALWLAAGVYASGQNTNPQPPPFSHRGGPGRFGGPGGPGMGGMLPMLGAALNLTDAQRDQIKTIAQSHRDEWKTLADRARTAHQALQAAVTSGTVDEGLIRQRATEVASVDADMAVARARVFSEVWQILTPDQQAKAKELQTQMQQRMDRRWQGRGQGPKGH